MYIDIVGNAQRLHRIDDSRIEVEKVMNFDFIDTQTAQN